MKTKFLPSLLLLATLGVAMPGQAADAPAPAPVRMDKAQAGFYHFKIGKVRVTALSDGTLPLSPQALLTNVRPGQVAARLAENFQSALVNISVNAYLIEAAGRLILVDAGTGELYGPTLDKLPAALRAAGFEPEQITDILITHIHTDHTGGLMDGTRMVYPNATLHLEQREIAYWLDPAKRARASAAAQKNFDHAVSKVKPYLDAGQIQPFSGAVTLFPGIRSVPAPGHTPGHSLYALESEGEKLLFWGDLLHVAEVQVPDPAVTIVFDIDATAAAEQRKRAFAEAAREKYVIAADHIAFPGVGRLRAEGAGYRWVPLTYVNDFVAGTR
ncbi:MBL fold metallo-hydrolase [Massilia sp. CF038]|uniref:MBL fold metallo-hydrolase n=1 Tax=Massilia sp. CF038 TaxID=1881045 RepID=UPI0009147EAD|nr:MBL fold metallo-hydrolase [Massilia sp. CF038]SHG61670.1 Glyoxylase, beta-lactamase superfamily II [Massilia sp. CF038]